MGYFLLSYAPEINTIIFREKKIILGVYAKKKIWWLNYKYFAMNVMKGLCNIKNIATKFMKLFPIWNYYLQSKYAKLKKETNTELE